MSIISISKQTNAKRNSYFIQGGQQRQRYTIFNRSLDALHYSHETLARTFANQQALLNMKPVVFTTSTPDKNHLP